VGSFCQIRCSFSRLGSFRQIQCGPPPLGFVLPNLVVVVTPLASFCQNWLPPLCPVGFVLPKPYPARASVSHMVPFSAAGMRRALLTSVLIIMNSWMARFCRDQARHS
jgi:hypothetical protein